MISILSALALGAALGSFAAADPACQNTLAVYNPNIRTTCENATWFILPIATSKVQSLTPYPLVTPPYSDKSLFPKGFPANTHPVLVSSGYENDIRMVNLQIPSLKQGAIYIPYTDRLEDGKTPFSYPLKNYIGGTDGGFSTSDISFLQAVVPALVGSAEGTDIFIASIYPGNDAYAPLSSNPNEYSTEVKQILVPNPISGPAVEPEVFDLDFITAKSPLYTAHTFHSLINQPVILTNTLCQRNTYYFNQTFTDGVLRSGNATVYGPLAGAAPAVLAGVYAKQGGYSASAASVGYNAESCASAAAKSDPKASR